MKRLRIYAAVTAVVSAVFGYPAFARSEHTVATAVASVRSFEAPPAGFDALKASAGDLAAYGFPARPDAAKEPEAYREWARMMAHARFHLDPTLKVTDHRHMPAKRAGAGRDTTTNSYNWSGWAVYSPPNPIVKVYGRWVIPAVKEPIGVCDGGTDYSSAWIGIDGFNNDDLVQMGTESDAACSGSVTHTNYYPWVEWIPEYETEITNFAVGPGQTMDSTITATSATTATAYLLDENTGVYASLSLTAPQGVTSIPGASAEWILERPEVGNALATLPNYGEAAFRGTNAKDSKGLIYQPGAPLKAKSTGLIMLDDNGNAESEPTLPGNSSLWTYVTGSAD